MRQVYDRHLGPDWPMNASHGSLWDKIDAVDDGELWETHQALKVQLIDIARRRAVQCAEQRQEPAESIGGLRRSLSVDALTALLLVRTSSGLSAACCGGR
jgi:hypothetical protein